jgi:hypothetical protein
MANEDPAPTESTPVPPVTPVAPPPVTPPVASGPAIPPPAAAPEPAWRPPPADSGRFASLFFGIVLIVLGLWYFASTTLGLTLPRLDWGQLWPILLIGIGIWVLFRSTRRRT